MQPATDLVTLAQQVPTFEHRVVWERIRDHLEGLHLDDLTDRDVWPRQATQEGIAEAVGVSRAHVALEIKRRAARAGIERTMAHVAGESLRRVVYRIAKGGRPSQVQTVAEVAARCPDCGAHFRVLLGVER